MKRSKRFLYVVVMVVVLSITIGYAALGSEMSISGVVAEIRLKKDIRVTDFLYSESTSSASVSSVEYSNKALITDVVLPNSDSSVTYKVEVTNFGNVEMGIYELTGLPENLTYEVTDYTLKEKICDTSNVCASGIVKTFYVTIKYASNGYSSTNTIYSLDMKVDFRQFYSVSYSDITINNYPTEVISGDTLKITFTDPIPSSVSVYLDGLEVASSLYSFVDGVLTYNNVLGNVVIKGPRTLYRVMQMATNGSDTNIDFSLPSSATNGDGVNTISGTEDDEYPIYYYRGNVENNNVLFAGYCWKMVRTTELGGVKLIYSGISSNNQCDDVAGLSSNAYLQNGYVHADGTNSLIKSFIDEWYMNNILDYTYFLEDSPWCNDLEITSIGKAGPDKVYYYAPYDRLNSANNPTIKCHTDYQLTVSATEINKKLKYPIALLTADEVVLSGNAKNNTNSTYLAFNRFPFLTMSLAYYDESLGTTYNFALINNSLDVMPSGSTNVVRPSLVLKNGIVIEEGTGTTTSPYTLDIPKMISFTVDSKIYYAEQGMTWDEWLDSQYNSSSLFRHNSNIICSAGEMYDSTDCSKVLLSDTIIKDNVYGGYMYLCAPV